MANPDKPSQLHKLKPFGRLAFNLVKVMDRKGNLNPASSCGFFAGYYGLTPDGTINGYRVMNFRTQRFTTKLNVRFNVQLPDLRYALSALVNSPQQMLVGRTIQKRFQQGVFAGTIKSFSTEDNVTLYDILYSDGDTEQMDILEVLRHISPIQSDMTIKRPNMHKRLRQSTEHNRARIDKDLLSVAPKRAKQQYPSSRASSTTSTVSPALTINTTTATVTAPNSNNIVTPSILTRRSTRSTSTPNRLTSTTTGSLANSNSLPAAMTTCTSNKVTNQMP